MMALLRMRCTQLLPTLLGPIFVAVSHQTGLDTRSKARRPIKVGIKGKEIRERAETRTLLVIDQLSAMWVKWGKQYHGSKSRSGHVCQNIAIQGVHKGQKAACPPECGPTEIGCLAASNRHWLPHPTRMPDGPTKSPECTVQSMGQIEQYCVFMHDWIAWKRTNFDIETVLTLNWIV